MKRVSVAMVVAMFGLACAEQPAPDAQAEQPEQPVQGEPTGERRVQYACDDGEAVEMRFFPLQGVGVLVRAGVPMELQEQPAGSGFHYAGGSTTVRGKGNELTIVVDSAAPISCRAR